MSDPGLLFGVDRAAFAASVVAQLRAVGLRTGTPAAERLCRSLERMGPMTRAELYWVLRLSLLGTRDDLERFDAWFEAVFGADPPPTAPGRGHDQPVSVGADRNVAVRKLVDGEPVNGAGLPWTRTPNVTPTVAEDGVGDDERLELRERLPSAESALDAVPFDLLDPDQLAALARRLDELFERWPTRPSRRRRRGSSGSIDLRRTLAAARRTEGEPLRLVRTRPGRRPRSVVVVLDVSGSMEPYATAYLHLVRALAQHRRAEVFAFGTDLTRLTSTLRLRSVGAAIDRATEEVGDRFGGTRIATSIGQLLEHRVWGNAVRGAEVLVVSDGWDTDPPEELARRCAALARRSHRLVWINPRVAAPDWEPRVAGMAAAAPHCDAVVPGHTVHAMTDVVELLLA